MKSEEIKDLFKQFESIVCDYHGVECWRVILAFGIHPMEKL